MRSGTPRLLLALTAMLVGWSPPATARVPRTSAIHPLARPVPVEDPSGLALRSLAEALNRARGRRGTARIVVLGASHTASDYFTGPLRRSLQRRYGDGGPGLLLPGRPWRGARHDALDLDASHGWKTHRFGRETLDADGLWGIVGAAMSASEPGEFVRMTPKANGAPGTRFDRIEVWFLAQPAGGSFQVRLGHRVLGEVSTGSPEVQARRWTCPRIRRPGPVEVRTLGDGEVRLLGVAIERNGPGVTVDALGVPGARLQDLLHAREDLLRETLSWRRPDLLVLAFGTNEAYDPDLDLPAYRALLRDGLRRLRTWAPEASCLLVGPGALPRAPGPSEAPPGARRREVTEAQRQEAQEAGCAFFDLAAGMGHEEGMERWVEAGLALRDRVHFTEAGYAVLAEVLLRGLREALDGPAYRPPPRRPR